MRKIIKDVLILIVEEKMVSESKRAEEAAFKAYPS